MDGVFALIAQLLYGSGLRLIGGLRLRVKDIDFEYAQIVVRDGKGHKDRVAVLPDTVARPLRVHRLLVREQHESALRRDHGGVELPYALQRKYPKAHLEWGWQ
jgi:integrase